jgi:hypothetical protein
MSWAIIGFAEEKSFMYLYSCCLNKDARAFELRGSFRLFMKL